MRLILGIVLALVAVAPAMAQNQIVAGVPAPVTRDGLTVALVHTEDLEGFVTAWAAGARALPISTRAIRGRPLRSIIIFQGCGAGADGKCNLTARFTYVRPDGSVEGEIGGELWTDPPAPDGRAIPAPAGPAITMEPGDPMGTWTVRVRVTDNIRNVAVDTEARIIVDTPPAASGS